ncbi:Serine/threonine-protein kinase Chk2-like [Oopsacas minuta]|uniref:Serine/threonine-protein kinase Chk2-like n=1 Tax=Oopsacas minuta TaxID=111878 RepID=A0AAV7KBL6_9METZ|nr:Serine/threonine-protein kinase Chk2-like [Oopsacas minuta]
MADCQTIDVSDIAGVGSSQLSEPLADECEANTWGRLYPLHDAYSKVDLIEDEYTFGRDEESTVCIHEQQNGCEVPNWQALSKVHFMIFREQPKSGKDQDSSEDSRKYGVFLYDKSSNGTFVNGAKIGKNKTCLLKDNSEISLSLRKNVSWVYKEKQRSSDYPDIPKEFLCRYDIGKTLGKGACGEVRICFEKETGNRSAVKLIEMKKFDKDEKIYKSAMLEVNMINTP